jgi:hypothetical protein
MYYRDTITLFIILTIGVSLFRRGLTFTNNNCILPTEPTKTRNILPTSSSSSLFHPPQTQNNISLFASSKMIVRIRSNVGTFRITIDDSDKEKTIEETILNDDLFTNNQYELQEPLSLDPQKIKMLNIKKSLKEQNIQHGTMIYCRLQEKNQQLSEQRTDIIIDNKVVSSTAVQTKTSSSCSGTSAAAMKTTTTKSKAKTMKAEVFDLIDSSDDEEEDNHLRPRKKAAIGRDQKKPVAVGISSSSSSSSRRSVVNSDDNTRNDNKKHQFKQTRASSSSSAKTGTTTGYSEHNNDKHSEFQIASYNVWFGPPDPNAKQVYPKERMAAIVECLQTACIESNNPLLFVGLQELTPSLTIHLKPLFKQLGYKMCIQPGLDNIGYGIGIVLPNDLDVVETKFIPYTNSNQGRGFLYVRTSTLLFATTHLESWCGPDYTGAEEREDQIVNAALFCQKQLASSSSLQLAMIVGDLNWDDERKQKRSVPPNKNLLSLLPNGWKDSGVPFDFTYDAKENPMLGGSLRRRFDRCIYLTTNDRNNNEPSSAQQRAYKSLQLQKIGKDPLPNLTWNKLNPYNGSVKACPVAPSDHFGLVISFGKN